MECVESRPPVMQASTHLKTTSVAPSMKNERVY